jgi:hypothetical protein
MNHRASSSTSQDDKGLSLPSTWAKNELFLEVASNKPVVKLSLW